MTENRIVFIEDAHEYNYLREYNDNEGTITHSLVYPISSEWSEHLKGTVALSIVENTGDLSFTFCSRPNKRITYSDAEELMLLLRLALEKREIKIGTLEEL